MKLARTLGDCTPLIQAAIVVIALGILRRLGFSVPTSVEVIQALAVSRSRTYELADEVVQHIANLPRPPGRPAKPTRGPPTDVMFEVAASVRDYLLRHPGAVTPGRRNRYTTGFRHFVIDLLSMDGLGHQLPLEEASLATGIPPDTLKGWLAAPSLQPEAICGEDKTADDGSTTGVLPGVIAQIVELWDRWDAKDNLTGFWRSLEQHRIDASLHLVRQVLELTGRRKPRRRGRGQLDPEAIRGALERFFPNAQLVADGKVLTVQVGDEIYRFCWELVVDADTGAHTGFAVRDNEDSQGLLEALEHSELTTGASPEALLSDNLPANHSDEVRAALDDKSIIDMPSTVFRPENKASVEGAFGLFEQTMPSIRLPNAPVREWVRSLVWFALFAYCAGRNHVPRPGLDNRSAVQAFAEDVPTPDEREQARRRLHAIKRRIENRQESDRRRTDPACRELIAEAFAEWGLRDPEGHFAHAIARRGLDATLEGLAVFGSRWRAGTLHVDCPERYLLGIVKNVSQRDEDLAVYHELVRLRAKANDLLLQPLHNENTELETRLSAEDYIQAVAGKALSVAATIDRHFWRNQNLEAFGKLSPEHRDRYGPSIARKIATSYAIPTAERDAFIAALARLTPEFPR